MTPKLICCSALLTVDVAHQPLVKYLGTCCVVVVVSMIYIHIFLFINQFVSVSWNIFTHSIRITLRPSHYTWNLVSKQTNFTRGMVWMDGRSDRQTYRAIVFTSHPNLIVAMSKTAASCSLNFIQPSSIYLAGWWFNLLSVCPLVCCDSIWQSDHKRLSTPLNPWNIYKNCEVDDVRQDTDSDSDLTTTSHSFHH